MLASCLLLLDSLALAPAHSAPLDVSSCRYALESEACPLGTASERLVRGTIMFRLCLSRQMYPFASRTCPGVFSLHIVTGHRGGLAGASLAQYLGACCQLSAVAQQTQMQYIQRSVHDAGRANSQQCAMPLKSGYPCCSARADRLPRAEFGAKPEGGERRRISRASESASNFHFDGGQENTSVVWRKKALTTVQLIALDAKCCTRRCSAGSDCFEK